METTPKEISPEAFAKCLQLLRGPSDEERFTGLLIVSKIIKADDTAKIKQVLDAIGFNFINRLLTSKPNAEGFSYTSLALSILSTFTSIPEFITTADFITKTSFLLDILETNDDVHTLDDAFQCILAIGSSEQGRTELFNSVHHGIRSLNKGLLKSLSSDRLIQRLEFFQQYVLYVREHIQNFPEISQLGKELATIIPPLCALFKENQDMLKFHIQSTLLAIITSIKDIPLSDLVRSSNTWSEDLRLGLFSVLTGKVTEQYRDPAIILTSILVDNLGPSWAWGSKGNPGSDGMFAELIVRLARIEIQLILEQPDNFVPKATLLTSSYSILEAAVSYLSSGSWNFNPERLENIQKTFSDVFSLILRYLLFCKEQGLKTDPIGLLSIRVLAVWLSEDTSTLRAEIFEALPFILEMHPLENDPTGVYDPFPVMIPALLNLTSEPEPLDMFVKSNGPQKLFQYINANCLALTQTLIKKDEKAANNAISMLGSCFGICLNLLSISSEFQANSMSDIFTSLVPSMELLSANVQRDADRLFILANMVTVALCLMRKLDFVKNMKAAYSPIIAYFSLVGTKQEESIADVWLLGLFGFVDCLNKDKEFLDAVANSKLPQIFIDRVMTADVTEDERQQWNAILTTLAARSTKARQTLIVHGGLQVATKYSFTQLQKLLQN